jgi:HSP20 family protein
LPITRHDPFREFAALQDRMNRLFGDVYLRDDDVAQRGSWVPPVDIYETEQHDLVIKAEVPDVRREDIEVTVENNTLILRGAKNPSSDVKEEQYRRIERSYGSFSRSFTLPTSVDGTKVSADYRNGVLTVRLPFREEARPRTVNVEIGS